MPRGIIMKAVSETIAFTLSPARNFLRAVGRFLMAAPAAYADAFSLCVNTSDKQDK
jgi:hypothetical protein